MKKTPITAALMALSLTLSVAAKAEIELPTTEILGAEYYCYEIKKGESLYGIAKRFGWDPDELARLNPQAAALPRKGDNLYYPTGKVIVVSQEEEDTADVSDLDYEPIRHTVSRGETVYGIARQYNIPVDLIYENHPSARHGIREGEEIVISQNGREFNQDGTFYYYEIKSGDTLYALARKYNTSVEQLLADNPGVTEKNFRAGDNIRIAVNSRKRKLKKELVDEERVKSIGNYKVEKNDTWSSVAEKTGATVEDLKSANADMHSLSKNDVIAVPVVETVKVEKLTEDVDHRETTSAGIEEIYEEVHNVAVPASQEGRPVKLALLVEDASAKREQEFTKGCILALEHRKKGKEKVSFKVVDGSASETEILEAMKEFAPDVIITTHEKNFPAYLSEFCNETSTEIFNIFDLKNEDYQTDATIVQFLTPSSYFNEETSVYLAERFGDSKIIFLGTPDKNDSVAEALQSRVKTISEEDYSLPNLQSVVGDSFGPFTFYAYPTDRKDVGELLDNIIKLKEENPGADIAVVGRPNWIVYADGMSDKFFDSDVYFPSRFYFEADSTEGKKFEADYTALFSGTMPKSFPVYPVAGYDVTTYLIDTLTANGGDFNRNEGKFSTGLQNDVSLKRPSNWGGFYNRACYVVRYVPFHMVDRIKIK